MQVRKGLAILIMLIGGLNGCTTPQQELGLTPTGIPILPTVESVFSCPVSLPGGSLPLGKEPSPLTYGNGALSVQLWPEGVVLIAPENIRPNGYLSMKFPWWRGGTGALRISGRRLDIESPPLKAYVPSGYGDTGFQSSGIEFPTEGCWEITGRVAEDELTFVALIQKTE